MIGVIHGAEWTVAITELLGFGVHCADRAVFIAERGAAISKATNARQRVFREVRPAAGAGGYLLGLDFLDAPLTCILTVAIDLTFGICRRAGVMYWYALSSALRWEGRADRQLAHGRRASQARTRARKQAETRDLHVEH